LEFTTLRDVRVKLDAFLKDVTSNISTDKAGAASNQTSKTTPRQQSTASDGFVRIEGGTFTMGSPDSEYQGDGARGERPQHQVTVSSFNMGIHEVTQVEYATIIGKNPSRFIGTNLPVENVSWYEAVEYCNKRSEQEGLTPAYTINGNNVTWNKNANGYRLPTEAEWEYACRAGTTTPFNTGSNITADQANYDGKHPYNKNQKGIYREKTTEVGSFAPNKWGLYDMHGNVLEWCWDRYAYDYYSVVSQTNPDGPVSGASRVFRGGSWNGIAQYLRSAYRNNLTPSFRFNYLGFRLVRGGL
jgi:formylglycine-generating enzyme required for sulfatase activity